MKTLRNVLLIVLVMSLGQFAFASPEAARAAFERLLGGYEAVTPFRPTEGIELEGSFPGETRDEAFSKVEAIIKDVVGPMIYPNATVSFERYSFETRGGDPRSGTKVVFTNKEGRRIVWEVKDDGSILPTGGEKRFGVEIVPAILYTKADRERAKTMIAELTKHGFQAEPASSALQGHAGFSSTGPVDMLTITERETVAQSMLVIWFFSKIEKDLIRLYDVHPDRARFAKPAPQSVVDFISGNQFDLDNTNLYQFIDSHYFYRYWALNMRALFQFGTIEIRPLNSTTDIAQIDQLMDLISTMVVAIKTKNPAFIQLMQDHLETDITVEQFADAMGIKSLQKKIRADQKIGRPIGSCSLAVGA